MKFPYLLTAAAVLGAAAVTSAPAKDLGTVDVQILAINDFHGNLEPPSGSSGRVGAVEAGGAEYLATHIAQLRAMNPNTVVVSAGDTIGASPMPWRLFHDEPVIEALNLMGFDFSAVGNHEFDAGLPELFRMQEGGCHPVEGCLDGDDFFGADFRFLAANVQWQKNHKPIFPAYKTRSFQGVQVAFIGVTLESLPDITSPQSLAGVEILDEAATVNALVPQLQKRGVEAFVVLLHEGGFQSGPGVTINSCVGIAGPVVDIVQRLDPEIDLVITGHTHNAYNCVIDGKVVTSAMSAGRLVTQIGLTVDRNSREVVSTVAFNRVVTRDVPPDAQQTALIDKCLAAAAPLINRVVGSITADITRTASSAGESALGDVVADAQLHATSAAGSGQAVVAFTNSGSLRADLAYAASGAEGDGNVTFGEMFAVQPFGNYLVTLTLTGDQIRALLEQQFRGCGQSTDRILQVSNGFRYTWTASAPACSKVDPSSIRLNGVVVDPAASYRVTTNEFLATGGEGFLVFTNGTNRVGGPLDLDALEAYLGAFSPLAPGPQSRITVVP